MYQFRKLSPEKRQEVTAFRKANCRPWHSPPHEPFSGGTQYLLSAACFEHKHIVGHSTERMTVFENDLRSVCEEHAERIYAWCLLPNHYHVLLKTDQLLALCAAIGRLHGRMATNGTVKTKRAVAKFGLTVLIEQSDHTVTFGQV